MRGLLSGAWRYRHFILSSIRTDFRLRVARSRLGILWVVIAPLMQVAIFSLILSAIMSHRLPGIDNRFAYSIYLMAGFLAWFPFVEIVNRSVMVFIDNANAMKKIAFPRIVLPLICLGTAATNHLVFFVLVMIAYLLMGHSPGVGLLWYPLVFIVTASLAAGLGLVLGVLNVFMRDVQQLVAILLQFGFWMTPIVYMITIIPEAYRDWLKLNPMFWVVDNHHRIFAYGLPPDWMSLGGLALMAAGLLGLALFLFRRASGEMVDAL
jgi:lipopolysaccharide transport system permease protein